MTPPSARIPAEERRQQIVEASVRLFAEHDFHAVTTKAIAEAAGVSEALLYKHFAGKEQLYAEIQRSCIQGSHEQSAKLATLTPGTHSLVLIVTFLTHDLAEGAHVPNHREVKRLYMKSIAGDGEFARGFFAANAAPWVPGIVHNLEATAKEGDVVERLKHSAVRVWLGHHLLAMLGAIFMHEPPLVDYGADRKTVIEETIRFGLRGLGLKPEAIAKHYQPSKVRAELQRLGAAIEPNVKENET